MMSPLFVPNITVIKKIPNDNIAITALQNEPKETMLEKRSGQAFICLKKNRGTAEQDAKKFVILGNSFQ